ncbi:MAG: GNAT family N-acetyltransferase, partial [Devosiaceae bacterium]|nr:GNAT family N-acetyltransferase [Devosiaceae bacterium MH13]
EMTWTLWDKSHEGYGYATEASRAILQAWRGPRLVARVAPDNAASVAMAHRLGFVEDPAATPPAYDPNMVTFRAPDPLQPVKDDNLV